MGGGRVLQSANLARDATAPTFSKDGSQEEISGRRWIVEITGTNFIYGEAGGWRFFARYFLRNDKEGEHGHVARDYCRRPVCRRVCPRHGQYAGLLSENMGLTPFWRRRIHRAARAFIDWASLPDDTATAMFFFYNPFRAWADTTLASSGSGALNNFEFGPPYYRSFTFYIGGQSQYISASTEELYVTRVGIAPNGSLWPTPIINFRALKTRPMGSSKAFATQAGYGRLP